MSDGVFNFQLKGENSDLIRKIDATTDRLNKQRDLVLKFNRERSSIARQERKAAFESLSLEEKRAKLTQRQIDLERRLNTARKSGNDTRQAALSLSIARVRTGLASIASAEAASIASQKRASDREWARYQNKSAKASEADARGKLGAQLRGKVSSGASGGGFTGGAMFAAASRFLGPAAIFGALTGAARSALSFADEMSDLAEQLGVSRKEIIEITRAAGYAGASSKAVIGNLSTLAAARSAALSGDERSRAIFARYGVDPSQGNIIELAKSVSQGLGRGGMQAGDRGAMGQLFGRRPEAMIATLRNIQDVDAGMEGKIERLDAANARIEQFFNKVKEVNATIFASILQLADSLLASRARDLRPGRIGTMNGLDYIMSRRAPITNNSKGSGMADLRRLDDTVLGGVGKTGPTSPYDGSFRSPVAQADSLARMGIYIGGSQNSAQNIMRQQLTELKLIKEATRKTPRDIGKEL